MRKNGPEEKSQRLRASILRWALALVVVLLLAAPIAVQAELKATSLAYTWDYSSDEFEWGHASISWGHGEWIPLLQEVYFDDLGDRVPGEEEPDLCADGLTTQYKGWIQYGLPLADTEPLGAEGFVRSYEHWYLIDCDLNGDGTWDRDDLVAPMPLEPVLPDAWDRDLVACSPGDQHCDIQYRDQVEDCPAATSEHCTSELATQLVISLDDDCDGQIDDQVAADLAAVANTTGLCVYSWALTPEYEEGDAEWTFPLPVRITDADGAKTLMLYPVPTAVELASFRAELQGRNVLLSWETATELDNLGFNVYRANAAGGERVRVNSGLIPSQNVGSAVGSSYQFVDRSAEPDAAYHYWLEDIDLGGARAMNGPVAVHIPRARRLPCRSRPVPLPGQME